MHNDAIKILHLFFTWLVFPPIKHSGKEGGEQWSTPHHVIITASFLNTLPLSGPWKCPWHRPLKMLDYGNQWGPSKFFNQWVLQKMHFILYYWACFWNFTNLVLKFLCLKNNWQKACRLEFGSPSFLHKSFSENYSVDSSVKGQASNILNTSNLAQMFLSVWFLVCLGKGWSSDFCM